MSKDEKGRKTTKKSPPARTVSGSEGRVRIERGELPPREVGGYRTQKVYYMGRSYEIPVDDKGFVPVDAMVMRFQEIGKRADKGKDSKIIYPRKATPRDIVKWWSDPSKSDVRGIDTKNSDVYNVSGIRGKRMREVQKRIGIVTPSLKEQTRIRRILANSFTAEELERMTKGTSFVIRTMKDGGDVVGYYLRRSDGFEVPLITIEEGATPDHVVHEAVHHLRTTRPPGEITSSAFPQRKDGKFDDMKYNSLTDAQRRRIHDAEETATAAEAVARTHKDPDPTGYYDYAGGREAYERDRARMAKICGGGDCTLKGAAAQKAVKQNYDKLDIAMASILGDVPAREAAREIAEAQKRANSARSATASASVKRKASSSSGRKTAAKKSTSTKKKTGGSR